MTNQKINIRVFNQFNRSLQTKLNLKQGQTILNLQPIAFSVISKFKKQFCNYCLIQKQSLLRCTVCTTLYYCSTMCQKADWAIHKQQCKIYQKITKLKKFSITSQFMLLTRIYLKCKKNSDFQKKIGQLLNLNDYQTQQKKFYFRDMAVCFIQNFQLQKTPQLLQKVISISNKIAVNAFTIQDYLFAYQGIAIGIYYPANFINHSCSPNAIQVFDGTNLKIIALKDIEPEQEITISYIDQLLDLKQRNKLLKQNYLFDCSCYQCLAQKTVKIEYLDLICLKCKSSSIQQKAKGQFQCKECQTKFSNQQINKLIQQIRHLKKILQKQGNYIESKKSFFQLKKKLRFSNPSFAKILQNLYLSALNQAISQSTLNKQEQKYQHAYKILKTYIQNFRIWYKMDQNQQFHVLLLWKYSQMGKLCKYLNKIKKAVVYTQKAIEIYKKCKFSKQYPQIKELKMRQQQLEIECRMNMTQK